MTEHEDRAQKVECIGCRRWFSTSRRSHGWVCPACSRPTPPPTPQPDALHKGAK